MENTVSRRAPRDLGVLVYDGQCGFCRRCVEVMLRRLRRHPQIVAWQEADLAQLGLSAKQCQEAVQWVSEIGGESREHFSAEDAVGKVLRNAGGLWRGVGLLIMLPGIHWLSGVVYRWVARSR